MLCKLYGDDGGKIMIFQVGKNKIDENVITINSKKKKQKKN